MAVLKQRKIDCERRVLQDNWTDQDFFIAPGLEIRGSNGSKCYHILSFATGMLLKVVANICYCHKCVVLLI